MKNEGIWLVTDKTITDLRKEVDTLSRYEELFDELISKTE